MFELDAESNAFDMEWTLLDDIIIKVIIDIINNIDLHGMEKICRWIATVGWQDSSRPVARGFQCESI